MQWLVVGCLDNHNIAKNKEKAIYKQTDMMQLEHLGLGFYNNTVGPAIQW